MKDAKEVNGKVVQLTLIDVRYPEFSIIFYYGLGRCEAAFKAARMEGERVKSAQYHVCGSCGSSLWIHWMPNIV